LSLFSSSELKKAWPDAMPAASMLNTAALPLLAAWVAALPISNVPTF